MRPEWLQYGETPLANSGYKYQKSEGEGRSLQEAREACLLDVSTYVRQYFDIQKDSKTQILFENQGKQSLEKMSTEFVFKVHGESVHILVDKKDEYWEYWVYPDGRTVYRCYILFAVYDKPGLTKPAEIYYSGGYGTRAMWRSLLVPGWGQFYKGSNLKGSCILSGEILLVAGIVVGENLRSDNLEKALNTLNVDLRRDYAGKADNWKNMRNVCIAGTAALYVYNVVDAIVAVGMKRAVKDRRISFIPRLTADECGIVLGFRF